MTKAGQFNFVATDLLPDFPIKLEQIDEDGTVVGPIVLSTFSSIVLRMRREDGKLITSDIVVDDDANGEGHFEWVTGDLTNGNHEAEIRLVRVSDSKAETIPPEQPMIFQIRDQV